MVQGVKYLVEQLPQLEELHVGDCDLLTNAAVAHLCKLRRLSVLNLAHCRLVTAGCLPLLCNAPALR